MMNVAAWVGGIGKLQKNENAFFFKDDKSSERTEQLRRRVFLLIVGGIVFHSETLNAYCGASTRPANTVDLVAVSVVASLTNACITVTGLILSNQWCGNGLCAGSWPYQRFVSFSSPTHRTNILYGSASACIDPEVKRSKVKVTQENHQGRRAASEVCCCVPPCATAAAASVVCAHTCSMTA